MKLSELKAKIELLMEIHGDPDVLAEMSSRSCGTIIEVANFDYTPLGVYAYEPGSPNHQQLVGYETEVPYNLPENRRIGVVMFDYTGS